jgi:hypothetical protein
MQAFVVLVELFAEFEGICTLRLRMLFGHEGVTQDSDREIASCFKIACFPKYQTLNMPST